MCTQTSTTVETYSGYCSGNGVLEFNKGSSGFIFVLNNLSIFLDIILRYISHLSFRKWRKDAARHASTSTMKSRLSRKLIKAGIADQREAKECVL